jgi:acyl-CoA reductase-like NAD-dependent aldehyde dehydrogenase
MIRPEQKEVVASHVAEALARGAATTTGTGEAPGLFVRPVVLRDVDHGMRVMREETFGPVLPLMAFDGEAEAVRLANDSAYGLGASVWTRDGARARRVASALECGSVAINDVIVNIAHPGMPFGGVKRSGWGRYHGPEGLRAFSRVTSVMVGGRRRRRELNWFPYGPESLRALKAVLRARHGSGGVLRGLREVVRAVMDGRRSG